MLFRLEMKITEDEVSSKKLRSYFMSRISAMLPAARSGRLVALRERLLKQPEYFYRSSFSAL
jgi:hypothetical protein